MLKDFEAALLFFWISNNIVCSFYRQNYEYFVEDEEARIREMEVMDRLLEVISLER